MAVERSESREDYLESILMLKAEKGVVRSIDIAEHFDYSRPSISRAMSILRSSGLITMDNNGFIELTEEGMKEASAVYARHKTLIAFLEKLGVSAETAEQDACRIEHVLSEESMSCIRGFVGEETE
ncbi:MAG: metal-dependent transcriptional regulator [Lachnospiraceae bacterium]|nr:metal-dependent transcriptional regulator [Lachnospiraceae bacterium]